MSSIIRLAICQLKCHPAIYSGQQMWLEEPFVPENTKSTLSSLSIQGFAVNHLLEYCKEKYVGWHRERIKGVLRLLKSLKPIPSIVLLPEGSVPYQCLDIIHAYSSDTITVVFAGTHSIQNLKDLVEQYKAVGVRETMIQKLFKSKKSEINGVLSTGLAILRIPRIIGALKSILRHLNRSMKV